MYFTVDYSMNVQNSGVQISDCTRKYFIHPVVPKDKLAIIPKLYFVLDEITFESFGYQISRFDVNCKN